MLTAINPQSITPLHGVKDTDKLAALGESMTEGWQGRPLLAIDLGNNDIQAITGSHRIAAAIDAGLDRIPVYIISTEDHITDEDGNCEVCGEECWVEMLMDGTDDSDRVTALKLSGDSTALEIMQQE